jgi:hypothetical protein
MNLLSVRCFNPKDHVLSTNYTVVGADTYTEIKDQFCNQIKAYVDSELIKEVDDFDFYPYMYTSSSGTGADLDSGADLTVGEQLNLAIGFKKGSGSSC